MSEPSDAVSAAFEAWLDERDPSGGNCQRRDLYFPHHLPLLWVSWHAAVAAERERLRSLVEAHLPQYERMDDERAAGNALRWVLKQLEGP